jgi:hypothetical protein
MARDGIAHGKSDDRACSPDPLDAYRLVIRGFIVLGDTLLMIRVDLRSVERNMTGLRSIE